jgi:F-type H+-transporting ATPase subunit delta
MSYVAFQYAEALFSLAFEENRVEDIRSTFQQFIESQDEEISNFLNHPKVTTKAKKEIIGKVMEDSLFVNFVNVLLDNNRIDFIEDIYNEFNTIVDNQNKVMNAFVYSNRPLTKTELMKLNDNLSKKHNRTVKLENIVEPNIIGGLRVEFEGNVLDETINNYLQSLKRNLTK